MQYIASYLFTWGESVRVLIIAFPDHYGWNYQTLFKYYLPKLQSLLYLIYWKVASSRLVRFNFQLFWPKVTISKYIRIRKIHSLKILKCPTARQSTACNFKVFSFRHEECLELCSNLILAVGFWCQTIYKKFLQKWWWKVV